MMGRHTSQPANPPVPVCRNGPYLSRVGFVLVHVRREGGQPRLPVAAERLVALEAHVAGLAPRRPPAVLDQPAAAREVVNGKDWIEGGLESCRWARQTGGAGHRKRTPFTAKTQGCTPQRQAGTPPCFQLQSLHWHRPPLDQRAAATCPHLRSQLQAGLHSCTHYCSPVASSVP